MKERMTPKEAIDFILEEAPTMLKEDKFHAPILFAFGMKDNAMLALEFKDSEAKKAAMKSAGRVTARVLPYCVASVSEAWMAKRFPPEGKEIHDMPDKEECLVVTAQSITGEAKGAVIPFTRIGEEIILGETITPDSLEAYILSNYWDGVRMEVLKHFKGGIS